MKDIFYRKVGKRYKAINDPYAWDGLTEGVWCVVVKPGGKSARRLVSPDMDSVDAALVEFKDILLQELYEASKLRPISTKITKKERAAWDVFEKTMGKDMPVYFTGFPSHQEMVDKAIDEFGKQVKLKQLRLAPDNT